MIQCPHCEWPFSRLSELQTHMVVKHNQNVPEQLISLYLDMKKNPDDQRKRLVYFEALADARLTDFYRLHDELQNISHRVDAVRSLSDVGNLFDGHDELNEYTHEANEKHLTAALDKIHAIASGAKFDFIGGIPVLDDTIPDSMYERDGKWYPRVADTDPAAKPRKVNDGN